MFSESPALVIGPDGAQSRSAAVVLDDGRRCNLVRVRHVSVEDRLSKRNKAGMRHPGAVVSGPDLAQFVVADTLHRDFVGLRIVLDRNLRCHAAHRVRAAPVAGGNQKIHVGTAGTGLVIVTRERSGRTRPDTSRTS